MSNYHYFECSQHDPPLRSHEEFTQHWDDEYYRAGIRLAFARPLELDYSSEDSYFERNIRRFLFEHPRCELVIIDEYGERTALYTAQTSLIDAEQAVLRAEISDLNAKLAERTDALDKLNTLKRS